MARIAVNSTLALPPYIAALDSLLNSGKAEALAVARVTAALEPLDFSGAARGSVRIDDCDAPLAREALWMCFDATPRRKRRSEIEQGVFVGEIMVR